MKAVQRAMRRIEAGRLALSEAAMRAALELPLAAPGRKSPSAAWANICLSPQAPTTATLGFGFGFGSTPTYTSGQPPIDESGAARDSTHRSR